MNTAYPKCEGVTATGPYPGPCENPGRVAVNHPLLRRPLSLCGTHANVLANVIDIEFAESGDRP